MKILVLTDDRLGPSMAGSALRAWELARVLAGAGHTIRITAEPGSTRPADDPVELVPAPTWSWADAVLAPPWSLHLPAFTGRHRLIVDGATPLLAELSSMPDTAAVRWRRRTAAARLPLVAARADAVLAAGAAQHDWWRDQLRSRPEVAVLEVPFGIQEHDPPADSREVIGVPGDWSVVLWWGGVWPWLDLETLLAARARLGRVPISVVVPTATRPGGSMAPFSAGDLNRMAARFALSSPEVVPLEHWEAYDERHLVLNRASVMAFLHRAGPEAELSFRTRAMDALWTATPMLLSAGGEVARIAGQRGWGLVVEPGDPAAVSDALSRLLETDEQEKLRSVLGAERDSWRWSRVASPLVDWLAGDPNPTHRSLVPAMLRAAGTVLGVVTGEPSR